MSIYKNRIIRLMACKLWDFAEKHKIKLGNLAPYIFGLMIGRKPHKTKSQ